MKQTLLVIGSFLATSPAWATEADLTRVCPAESTPNQAVDPIKVVYAALDSVGTPLSRGVLDTNQDGTETMRERVAALLDVNYCSSVGKDLCMDGDTGSLDDARLLLQTIMGEDIVAETLTTPSAADQVEWPLLADPEYGRIAAMLDERRRFYRLTCPARTADAPRPQKRASGVDGLRLTGDIDSLSMPRGGREELRALTQAEVSYTNNRLEDSETFQVSAYLGYDFSNVALRQAIPFIGFEREQVRQLGPDDDGSSKVSIGFLYAADFDKSLDQLSIAPLYVVDRITDSRVASLRAAWTPGLLYRIDQLPMGQADDVGPFTVLMNLQLRAHAGRVIEVGSSEQLADSEDYVRLGPAFRLDLWPKSDHWLLSRLSADAGYRRFFRLSGSQDVEWWGAGINYSIEPTDHVTLRYSYEHGEDEETLEKTKQWKLILGIRF